MGKVMNNKDFVAMAKKIATQYKTLYIMGCFGAPMNNTNKNRYCNNHSYNKQSSRTNKIKSVSYDTFGFDCVCLIKGILWGWNGQTNKTYGGAVYASNGVPDVNADGIMRYCSDVSTNFNNIEIGELVHMGGHVGIYIGDGLAVECTPIWKDGVQITAVGNIGRKNGYNARNWVNHGKLNYIEYLKDAPKPEPTPVQPKPSTPTTGKFKIGDDVVINGDLYVSSNADKATGHTNNKTTKITRYASGAKHPYNTTGDLGWMDEKDISLVNTPKPEPTPQPNTYTVQRGDNLSSIAKKYNTTWQVIYEKNKENIIATAQAHGVKDKYYNYIYAGQKLSI